MDEEGQTEQGFEPINLPEYNELTRHEVIRLQALDMSVNSKAWSGGSTEGILHRAYEFEDYIRNGEK